MSFCFSARGKSKFPTRPPESPKELLSPSGSCVKSNVDLSHLRLSDIEDSEEGITIVLIIFENFNLTYFLLTQIKMNSLKRRRVYPKTFKIRY